MIQAEGAKAIENIDAILDVAGIDVIFVGPYDLSASLGIIGQIEHPKICSAIQEIVRKADAKGVKVGCFCKRCRNGAEMERPRSALHWLFL